MNNNEILTNRTDNFLKTMNREQHEYIPLMGHPAPGVVEYANTTLSEVIDDEERVIDALVKIFEDLECDVTVSQGFAFMPHAKDVLGSAQNYIGPDGITFEHVQAAPMRDDEYDLLINDPDSLVKDVLLPRMYPALFTDDMGKVKDAVKTILFDAWYAYVDIPMKIEQRLKDVYAVSTVTSNQYMCFNPIDIIFDSFRGFVGTTADLRRHKSKVHDAIDVLWETRCDHFDHVEGNYPYVPQWPHIPAYMNPKQFYEFYWPYQKKMIENINKNDNKLYMLIEGNWSHILDAFKDIPQNSVLMHCDDNDIIEMSKEVGDQQVIAGGANLHRLKMASKEANIDHAKKVIDACAHTNAFIFTTDKNWLCKGDVTQNLFDTYAFVREYGKY